MISEDNYLLIWLAIFFMLFASRYPKPYKFEITDSILTHSNILDYCIAALIAITAYDLAVVYIESYIVENIFIEFFNLLSLFVGFFIVRSFVKLIEIDDVKTFLFNIVLVNSLASGLYFLHQGLHIPLYEGGEFSVEIVQGELITRTFWFIPILSFFSIAYLLVFKKITSLPILALFVINVLGVFITYTKSYLLITILIISLYFILTGFMQRDYGGLVKNLFLSSLFGAFFFLGVSTLLPASTSYFIGRFNELKQSPADEESNSLLYRFSNTAEIINQIDKNKLTFGFGPVTENQNPFVENMRAATADMVWTGVIFRWGYSGFFLFVLLHISALIKSFQLFTAGSGLMSDFGLLFFLVIISQLIEGFTSWTFLSPSRFGLGLWYFGLLAGLLSVNATRAGKTE